jgi:hypothetical protein
MNLTRIDKVFFLPVAIVGCLICAFPVLVVIPTTEIHTALTGTLNLFLGDGILAWFILAGFFALLTFGRACYIGVRLRPFQSTHVIYSAISLFQVIAYTMVATGPFNRLDFFLNS